MHPEYKVRYWRPSRMKVPEKAHPLVRRLYQEIIRQQVPVAVVCEKAGLPYCRFRDWRTRVSPKIVDLEAAFNVLGYTLKPVEITE